MRFGSARASTKYLSRKLLPSPLSKYPIDLFLLWTIANPTILGQLHVVSRANVAAAFSQARQSAASFSASAARFWIWSAAMAQRAVGRCRGRWIRRLLRVVAIEVCFVGLCWPCGLVGLDESYSRAPPLSGAQPALFGLFCLALRKIIFAHGQFIDQ